MDCDEGFKRKLMFVLWLGLEFVLLLLVESDMDGSDIGDAGGSIALLRDRLGEGYETESEADGWSNGE